MSRKKLLQALNGRVKDDGSAKPFRQKYVS
jgi:hypothetical protein